MKRLVKKASGLMSFIVLAEVVLFPLLGVNDLSGVVQASSSSSAGASVYEQMYVPSTVSLPQAVVVSVDATAPSIPRNMTAQNVTSNGVVVGWDKAVDNEGVLLYEVYRNDVLLTSVADGVYSSSKMSYTDSGLSPQTEYKYQVNAVDQAGNKSSLSSPITITTLTETPSIGQGVGLRAEYYSGMEFDALRLRRLDEKIDINLDSTLTDAGLNVDSFSVRWSGKIQPKYTELYTLYTESHGGVRLWVNGQLLVDRWTAKGRINESASTSLTAGQLYDIRMEFHDDNGISEAALLWSSPSQSKEVIPRNQLYPPFIPGKPSNLHATTTSSTVVLSWDPVSGAEGYDVEADGVVLDQGPVPATTFMHQRLTPYSQHIYRVRAKIPELASDWTEGLVATTMVGIPDSFRADVSEGNVTLSWDAVTGATRYELEIDGTLLNNGLATSYVHGGLQPNTEHSYRVRALNDSGEGDWSPLLTRTVFTEIPTNLSAQSTARSIVLSWDEVSGAAGYEIESDGQTISVGMQTTYSHLGLEPNTRHEFRVRAVKADGAKAWSTYLYKSTLPESGHGIGLKAEYFDKDNLTDLKTIRIDPTINFDWKQSSPAEGIQDGVFSVRWSGQVEPAFSEDFTFYTEAHGGVRLWVNKQLLVDDWSAHNMSYNQGSIRLEAGKRYDLKMEYLETNGTSLAKLYWESASQAKDVIPQILLYPIGAAQNLTTSSTETSITLNWEAASFAEGYEVEVDGEVVDNGSELIFTHTDLIPGTRHTYRVRAKSAGVIGEWSPVLSETTKLGTTNISDIIPTENTLDVLWEPVYGATGYDIEVDGAITDNGNQTEYVHDELLSGTLHQYRVRAKSEFVTGPWSQASSKWTLPDVPQDITVASTSSSVSLRWSEVRGATGYDVEKQSTIMDNGPSVFYEDSELNPNTPYTYKVRAKNSSGPGQWSSVIAKVTLPGTPDGLTADATESEMNVTWGRVAGATHYEIEVDGTPMDGLVLASYRHSSLLSNTSHTYRVRAWNEEGASNWSPLLEATTLPSIPENFTTSIIGSSVLVSWSEVDGVQSYDLEIDGVSISTGTQIVYNHASLAPNSEHTYRVRTRSARATGAWSRLSTILMPPSVPANVQTTVGSSQIEITWDMVQGATGYEIEVDGVAIDNGSNISYQHQGIDPNSPHTYRVRAKNAGGASDWSISVSQITLFGKPQQLQAKATTTTITITWEEVAGASAYDVFVDGDIVDNGSNHTFTHTGLAPYSWHVYRVRAKSSESFGEWSDPLTTSTLLGTPGNIQLQAGSDSITVSWDGVFGASAYEVEADGQLIDNGLNTTYVHSNLGSNSTHTYRVRAKNESMVSDWSELITKENGLSEWSNKVTETTAPNIPTNLTATATTNQITLSWDTSSSASSYELEVDGAVVSGISGTSYAHSGLEPNTMHVYRVRALKQGKRSEWSASLSKVTTPQITINVEKDTTFNFIVVAPKKEGVTTRTVTVNYNPDELEVLDLSLLTPDLERSAGAIEGTDITIVEFTPGKIVFRIGRADKTVVNSIQFMSITSKYSKITYTVE